MRTTNDKLIRILATVLTSLILSACTWPSSTPTPESRTGRGFAYEWYVARDGNDSNSCSHEDEPCETIQAVLERSLETDESLFATYDDVISITHTVHIGPGTYFETTTSRVALMIQNHVHLIGSGEGVTIIDAGGSRGGMDLIEDADVLVRDITIQNASGDSPGNCLNLSGTSTASLENVTLRQCNRLGIQHISSGRLTLTSVTVTAGVEGGVFSSGPLNITSSDLVNNRGYGIVSRGDLTMSTCTIEGNAHGGLSLSGNANLNNLTVRNNGSGELGSHAGLVLADGRATVTDSSFSNHPREGVRTVDDGAELSVSNSVIEGNDYYGVGIEGGTVTFNSVTIRDNGILFAESSIAGGIEVESGTLTLENSHVVHNHHGGILVEPLGTLTMRNTAIEDNLRDYPGLWNNGVARIESSSITNNAYSGIENRGEMRISNTTISNNTDNGISATTGQLSLEYVTIAQNGYNGLNAFRGDESVRSVSNVLIASNGNEDCEISSAPGITPFSHVGTNFDSDGTCHFSDILTPDMHLGALTAVGTLPESFMTAIHPLLEGSPAIDAASGSCPPADQHDVGRPVGGGCDVGASEFTFAVIMAEDISDVEAQPPTVNTQSLCREGPGAAYLTVSAVEPGTIVVLIGVGEQDGWLVIDNPVYAGVACWLPEQVVDLDTTFDLSALPEIQAPPLPTATPTEGPALPSAPSNLKESGRVCNASEFSITLTWTDNASNEAGYIVYRDGQVIATLGADAIQYTDTLPDFLAHNYVVEAFNDAGSAPSNSIQTELCFF